MTIDISITHQVNTGKASRSGGLVASSGSTEAMAMLTHTFAPWGFTLLAKGAELSQEPRVGRWRGLLPYLDCIVKGYKSRGLVC